MTAENKGFSRRKLLKAGAIGVPAAGVLAFGSTLVTATSANAISADGWWGSETSAGFQRFMNAALGWQGAAFRFFISHFTVILRVSRRLSVVVCC